MTELYRVWAEPLNDYYPYMAFRRMPKQGTGAGSFIEKVEISIGRRKKDSEEEVYEYFKFKNINELFKALSGVGILLGMLGSIRGEDLSAMQTKALQELKDGIQAGIGRYNLSREEQKIPLPVLQDKDLQQGSGLERKGLLPFV